MTTTAVRTPSAGQTLTPVQTVDLGGKYLTFKLKGEVYGVYILKVREIIGCMDITVVPGMPEYVKGVINLRGKVIPVVGLRARFDLPEVEATEETCIIVIDVGEPVGIVVDAVQEVLDIENGDIEPPPSLGCDVDNSFILGMAKTKDSVRILLDIQKILTAAEWERLAEAKEEEEAKAEAEA